MNFTPNGRAALVVAHPGHELRVHGWLETARPLVFVLTDGSGRSRASRLASTAKVLSHAGARAGVVFGRFSDAEIYFSILKFDSRRFTDLATELAVNFSRQNIDYVVGDASEGYNPAHDLCRLILNAAVQITERRDSRQIGNFAFPLIGHPDNCSDQQAIRFQLDDDAFARKIKAARNYPELQGEVADTVGRNGMDAFRSECLQPVRSSEGYVLEEPPFYESYGERQVSAGFYPQVLRYRQHMLPIAEALQQRTEADLV
jgi:hypothetical protein